MSLIYPPVDKLLEKIGSRYELISLASKRAKELEEIPRLKEALLRLQQDEKPTEREKYQMQNIALKLDSLVGPTLEKFKSVKPIGKALEEINAGNVKAVFNEKDNSNNKSNEKESEE